MPITAAMSMGAGFPQQCLFDPSSGLHIPTPPKIIDPFAVDKINVTDVAGRPLIFVPNSVIVAPPPDPHIEIIPSLASVELSNDGQDGGKGPSGNPPPKARVAGGGSNGRKPIDAESYWKLVTQGGPLIADAAGNFARSFGTAAQLYRAGTYRDDPLGTQDPHSIASWPMQMLLPDRYFGKGLTLDDKRALDVIAGGWNQGYFLGKIFKYGGGIIGNVASMSKIVSDENLTQEERRDLTVRNFYDFMGNAAFLVEKGCYSLALPVVGLAQMFGQKSVLWDVGYLGGAALYNIALGLASIAWYGKVRSSISMVNCEKNRFMAAYADGKRYDIDSGCVNVALFNFANALGRVPKHFVAHVTTVGLGLALYYPETFSFIRNSDFINKAAEKLGDGTPADLVYAWSSFGFMVPTAIVGASILFCAVAPILGLSVNIRKTLDDIAEHLSLRRRRPEPVSAVVEKKPEDTTPRIAQLKRQHMINGLGISAGLCVLGSGIATAYPATEPHSIFLTAIYGLLVSGQFAIGQFDTLKALPSHLLDRLRSRNNFPAETAVDSAIATASTSKKGFFRNMVDSIRASRAILKEAKENDLRAIQGLSQTQRIKKRWQMIKSRYHEWRFFMKAYMSQKKQGTDS